MKYSLAKRMKTSVVQGNYGFLPLKTLLSNFKIILVFWIAAKPILA